MSNDQVKPQTIQLDFISADENNPDPATVGEFGRAVVKQLLSDGYDVQPLYTGEKGGEHFILTIVQTVWDHKEVIASTVGGFIKETASALGSIKTIIEVTKNTQEKLKPSHPNIEEVTIKLLSDGTEVVTGSPKAANQYVVERLKDKEAQGKNLKVSVAVPAKPKKRR